MDFSGLASMTEGRKTYSEVYEPIKRLGAGAFGTAWLIKKRSNGLLTSTSSSSSRSKNNRDERSRYVAKEIPASAAALAEADMLARLSHANVLRYHEQLVDDGKIFIITELCANGDLKHLMDKRESKEKPFTEAEVLSVLTQVLLGLQYIHAKGLLHRDVKPPNIFITAGNTIKLGDFGLSKELPPEQPGSPTGTTTTTTTGSSVQQQQHQQVTSPLTPAAAAQTAGNQGPMLNRVCGTPIYYAPELVANQPYNQKADIWALGCVVAELMTFRHPFKEPHRSETFSRIKKGDPICYPDPSRFSPELRHIVYVNMLNPDPKKRMTCDQLLDLHLLKDFITAQEAEMEEVRKAEREARAARASSPKGPSKSKPSTSSGGQRSGGGGPRAPSEPGTPDLLTPRAQRKGAMESQRPPPLVQQQQSNMMDMDPTFRVSTAPGVGSNEGRSPGKQHQGRQLTTTTTTPGSSLPSSLQASPKQNWPQPVFRDVRGSNAPPSDSDNDFPNCSPSGSPIRLATTPQSIAFPGPNNNNNNRSGGGGGIVQGAAHRIRGQRGSTATNTNSNAGSFSSNQGGGGGSNRGGTLFTPENDILPESNNTTVVTNSSFFSRGGGASGYSSDASNHSLSRGAVANPLQKSTSGSGGGTRKGDRTANNNNTNNKKGLGGNNLPRSVSRQSTANSNPNSNSTTPIPPLPGRGGGGGNTNTNTGNTTRNSPYDSYMRYNNNASSSTHQQHRISGSALGYPAIPEAGDDDIIDTTVGEEEEDLEEMAQMTRSGTAPARTGGGGGKKDRKHQQHRQKQQQQQQSVWSPTRGLPHPPPTVAPPICDDVDDDAFFGNGGSGGGGRVDGGDLSIGGSPTPPPTLPEVKPMTRGEFDSKLTKQIESSDDRKEIRRAITSMISATSLRATMAARSAVIGKLIGVGFIPENRNTELYRRVVGFLDTLVSDHNE